MSRIDNKKNTVSPILSVIEGQSGRKEKELEVRETLDKESRYIGVFFKDAFTDTEFFSNPESVEEFVRAISNNFEHSWPFYVSFIEEIFPVVCQPVSKNKIKNVERDIFDIASRNNVQVSHPVFIAALATLYGHEGARKVIKPKREYSDDDEKHRAAYNAASDLVLVSRVGFIRSIINENTDRSSEVKLVTFDKGILSFFKEIQLNWVSQTSNGGTAINASYGNNLFPFLGEDGWKDLRGRLQEEAERRKIPYQLENRGYS